MEAKPSRQAARSQSARDQITQAALTIFSLKGYAAASMDDVCLAAGCSKGGLYHHFPNKPAVLAGVVERLAGAGALMPPFQAAEGQLALGRGSIGRVLLEIWAEASHDAELRRLLRSGYEACIDRSLREGVSAHSPLVEILRIGVLVQMLSRTEDVNVDEAARRLGIERAA
ncbi:MAG TPA: TetR/AcrR family transcriptional regulator [Dehalococcoidia bacterium]|nr:TetR/AcrR family transcriptional regulator [Dehalococcoidia bacterium]